MRRKLFIGQCILTVLVTAALTCSVGAFAAEQTGDTTIGNLNLTEEQVVALAEVIDESSEKQLDIIAQIEGKFAKLGQEIRKEDRFEIEQKGKRTVRKANQLVKEIVSLYGQLLKTRVEYLLKAKNVLTKEQKVQLISGLEFDDDYFEGDLPEIIEVDIVDLPIDLTQEQIKKILRNQTDMKINALKIALEIEYSILDLQTELTKPEADPQNVDKIILRITDLGTKLLDSRVNYFLKSKDVLTVPQKKMLIHALMM